MGFDEVIQIRCTSLQKERWEEAAKLDRRRFTDWVRMQLDDAADKAIEESEGKK